MGSLRRGLIATLALLPSQALAGTCAVSHPNWDGTPVGMAEEALALAMSPAALILICMSMLALRFKSQWGALMTVLLWTGFLSLITMLDPTGSRVAAQAEGCIGSPALFIGLVIALCALLVMHTMPRLGKSS